MNKALRFLLGLCAVIALSTLAEAQSALKCKTISGIGSSKSDAKREFDADLKAFRDGTRGKLAKGPLKTEPTPLGSWSLSQEICGCIPPFCT